METSRQAERVLVSDFDGTMTRHDFYKLAIEKLIPDDTPDYWAQYRSGSITHFEALRLYFAAIRGTEDEVLAVVRQTELDPKLPSAIESLRRAGWRVVVTSAGCAWYIQWLLKSVGIELEIHSNPGHFDPERGLVMQMPTTSPFWSPTLGINKTAVVRDFLQQDKTVAFAGDGFPDADPARLIPADRRFARADLADVLRSENEPFQPFHSWSDIASTLLQREA